MKNKNKQSYALGIVYTELRAMLPLFLAANGVAVAASVLYVVFGEGDFRLFTGLVAGNAIAVLNFILLGVTAELATLRKTDEKVRFAANMWYGIRYVGLFIVLAFLLAVNAANIATLLFPLFLPRLYYFLIYTPVLKGKENRQFSKLHSKLQTDLEEGD